MTSRAERVMAVVRWVLLASVTAVAAYSVYTYGLADEHGHGEQGNDRYYCPMHPQIRSHDPGECPICHMRLEPIPHERLSADTQRASAPDGGASAVFAPPPANLTTVMVSIDRQQLIGVRTTAAERRPVVSTVRVSGVVEAREGSAHEVHVRAPSFIERLVVHETGARVGRGQVLAWIYSPDVARTRDELRVAQAWVATDTAADGDPSGADVTAAGATNLARLGVEGADVARAMSGNDAVPTVPLRANGGGVVTRFAANVGTFATPELALYEITDLRRVWVAASVPEREMGSVAIGAHVSFTLDGHPDALVGEVVRIEPISDVGARAARVRVEVENRELALRPGQVGSVSFADAPRDALVVPRDAVVDTGTHRYVFVDHAGTFEPRSVELGARTGDDVEIVRGLAAGELVVTRGGFLLDSESRLAASLRRSSSTGAAP